jgi:predicted RNA-binding protein with PUA-like domain
MKEAVRYESQGYWLMKSEAEMYSIGDFRRDRRTIWTEVRNYQARNMMRDQMHVGDHFLFYHSNSNPSGVYGFGKVSKTGIGDPTALDRKSEYYDPKATKANNPWVTVEVECIASLPHPVSLAELKRDRKLAKMPLLQKGSRLSVMPITSEEFHEVLSLGAAE